MKRHIIFLQNRYKDCSPQGERSDNHFFILFYATYRPDNATYLFAIDFLCGNIV